MPAKLIVAYKTRLIEGFKVDPLDIPNAPSNWKDEAKIASWNIEKKAAAESESLLQPYTATFDEVQIVDLSNQEHARWQYRDPKSGRTPVSLAIRAWLLKHYPEAWPNTTHTGGRVPQAIFVGFNPRLFVKILGIECSLPEYQPKEPDKTVCLPLSCWYTNSDHRDIVEAVKPDDYKFLSWSRVMQRRGLAADPRFANWKEPHVDVSMDLALATELATQIGMMGDD